MAYSEYKNSGRSAGKILYQLNRIRLPLHVVEQVTMESNGQKVTYRGKDFATYVWNEQDVPVFTFVGEYESYNKLFNQEHKYSVMGQTSKDSAPVKIAEFVNKSEIEQIFSNISPNFTKVYIENGLGITVNSFLEPAIVRESPINNKLSMLRNKFCK